MPQERGGKSLRPHEQLSCLPRHAPCSRSILHHSRVAIIIAQFNPAGPAEEERAEAKAPPIGLGVAIHNEAIAQHHARVQSRFEERKARRTSDGHLRTIYLVMGGPVAAYTTRHELKADLKRQLDTFANPLVYTFGAHQGPSIVTMSAALAEGRGVWCRLRSGHGTCTYEGPDGPCNSLSHRCIDWIAGRGGSRPSLRTG